ncbi:MAG: hypothetical protein A3J83_01015 [Elusimicrobia bacterium RIFOXYA2_FULL_40_6]|nr:MAG: hypothetical protein A3J83_01015 [Elusimicrobia bacterium RIFOXYA2_FULL_40_6]
MKMFNRIFVLVCVVCSLAGSGWSASWEKGLKISGLGNMYSAQYTEWHSELAGNFIRRSPFSSWYNQVKLKYGEQEISNTKSIIPNELTISETYDRNIGAFSLWEVNLNLWTPLSTLGQVGNTVISDTNLSYLLNLSRYTLLSTGLKISKTITPDAEANYWWQATIRWQRPFGYYVVVSVNPTVEQELKAPNSTVVGTAASFSYKLGDKFTFEIAGTYKYNLTSKAEAYRQGSANLVYDVFRW